MANRLSGGEMRRLEIARSLTMEPRFLLFDEPFAGIDPLTIETLHQVIVRLRGRGIGILLTDHNVTEALSLCDRAYVLLDGCVLAEGTARELPENPAVVRHFLGDRTRVPSQGSAPALVPAGEGIDTRVPQTPTHSPAHPLTRSHASPAHPLTRSHAHPLTHSHADASRCRAGCRGGTSPPSR